MTQQPRRRPASSSELQPAWTPTLYDPGHGDDSSSPEERITLRQFYEQWFVPEVSPTKLTAKEDRAVIRRWEQFEPNPIAWRDACLRRRIPEHEIRTPPRDPDVREISSALVEAFFGWLAPEIGPPAVAVNTLAKYRAHLGRILKALGPGNGGSKKGAELVDAPPYVAPGRRELKRVTKLLELDEHSRVLEAARDAPPLSNFGDLPASIYQVRLHLFLHNTLLRIDTAMELRRPMLTTWKNRRWLDIPAAAMKGGKHGLFLLLNRCALEALDLLDTGDRLFPFENWPSSQSRLQFHRRQIWKAAGIVRPGEGYHDLRRWADSFCIERHTIIEQMITGRHSGSVPQEFYAKPLLQAKLLDELARPEFQPAWPSWLPRKTEPLEEPQDDLPLFPDDN